MNREQLELSCAEAREAIEHLLDASMKHDIKPSLRDHLAACSECSEEFESAQALHRVFETLPELDCPPQVTRRVKAEVRRRRLLAGWSRTKSIAGFLLTPVWRPALAAAVVAVLVAIPLLQQQPAIDSGGYTSAEIAEGLYQVKVALAYVGEAGRRTGVAVRDEAIASGVVAPIRQAIETAVPSTQNEE